MPFLQFYIPSVEVLDFEIRSLVNTGSKHILLVQKDEKANILKKRFDKDSLSIDILKDVQPKTLQQKINEYEVIVLTEDKDLNVLSGQLLSCLDKVKGTVLAPLTDHFFTKRALFIITIPKSGTHMLINFLHHLGIQRNYSHNPAPGKYSTLENYTYHASCKEFMQREWPESMGNHPLFRSPVIFMYRNPLDIIVSEFSWYQKPGISFSHYLKTFKGPDEKLMHLIDDPFVLGTVRERMNKYIGWMEFSNVIPVSYEELVGANGGGDNAEQVRTIWSLQLKLHIPGAPVELAKSLYSEKSHTFNKGKIGFHKRLLKKKHYARFRELPQDFMDKMGYDIDKVGVPLRTEEFRTRFLEYGKPTEEELWKQRLVKENYLGYNIIFAAGQYGALLSELGAVDLSKESARRQEGVSLGFESLEETVRFIISQRDRTFIECEIYKRSHLTRILILQPVVIWLTGIPFSGKTTIALALEKEFFAKGVFLKVLNENSLRQSFSKDLGCSLEERDIHDLCLAKTASKIVQGGISVCVASVTPSKKTRTKIKEMITDYVEVWTKCPKNICNKRDSKGTYESTQKDHFNGFMGGDGVYEKSLNADIIIETDKMSVEMSIDVIVTKLEELGYIKQDIYRTTPKSFGSYQCYNIIGFKDSIYGIVQGIDLDLVTIGSDLLCEYQNDNKLFITNTINEIKEIIDQRGVIILKSLGEYKDFSLAGYGGNIYAVPKGVEEDFAMIDNKKIKAYLDNGKLFIGESMGEVEKLIDQNTISMRKSGKLSIEAVTNRLERLGLVKQNILSQKPTILDSYQSYNLVGYKECVYAVLQGFELDLTKIKKRTLKEYQDGNRVLKGESIYEVKKLIDKKGIFLPKYLGFYKDYGLVGYKGSVYAVLQGVDLDVTLINKHNLETSKEKRECFVAGSIDEVRRVIDQKGVSIPRDLGYYKDYGLVGYKGNVYAVLQGVDLDVTLINKHNLETSKEKRECFVAGSIDEVRRVIDQKGVSIPRDLGYYKDYGLVGYKGNVYAVLQGVDLDVTLINKHNLETSKEKRECFVAGSIDEVRRVIDQKGVSIPRDLGYYKDYGLVGYKGNVYAVLQGVDLDVTLINKRNLETSKEKGECFVTGSIDEVKRVIDQKGISIPKLLESYKNFNFIRYNDRIYSVLQGCNLDLTKLEKNKLKKYLNENKLFLANTTDEAKDFINQKGFQTLR